MTTPPRIHLEAEAARHAARHGGAITLRATLRHGCCGGTIRVPVAETGAPMDQTAWLRCTVDGITIYVDRALNEHARALTVSAAGFRRWRRLFVESH